MQQAGLQLFATPRFLLAPTGAAGGPARMVRVAHRPGWREGSCCWSTEPGSSATALLCCPAARKRRKNTAGVLIGRCFPCEVWRGRGVAAHVISSAEGREAAAGPAGRRAFQAAPTDPIFQKYFKSQIRPIYPRRASRERAPFAPPRPPPPWPALWRSCCVSGWRRPRRGDESGGSALKARPRSAC